MEFTDRFEELEAGGVGVVMDFEAELFEGGLHEAGVIDRVFEVVLIEVGGIAYDEGDPFLRMREGDR